jgi:hypothetical protein
MANTVIQIRSSGVTGNVPVILQPGELAINFVDGKLFYGNALSAVTEFSTTTPAGLNGEIQFNSYGDLGATQNVRYEIADSYLYVNKIVANTLINSTLTDAYNIAQGAYDLANTLSGGTSTDGWARNAANSASSYANSAYLTANSAGSYANSSFDKANTSLILAQAAFDQANTGGSSSDSFARTTANSAYAHANSAYNEANTAYGLANTAFGRTTINGSYANSAFIKANSSFDKANTSELIAQSAYDLANTLSSGSSITIVDEVSSNNIYYVNFTDKISGTSSSLNVSSTNLTFKPNTGTLGVKELSVASNLSIVSGSIEVTGTSQTLIDSFSIDLFRTAFYQFQIESGSDFHSFSYNVGQDGETTREVMFGDIYSSTTLGTINSNVSSGLVNVMFTPTNENSIVVYSRNTLVKKSTGIGNDLGFLGLATATFDYGFVGGSATTLDLGMLA